MPHPCQNMLALTVMGGHSRDMCKPGDVDSGCYQCRPNKPDKEAIGAAGVKQRLTRLAGFWPDSNAWRAECCALLSGIPAGHRHKGW